MKFIILILTFIFQCFAWSSVGHKTVAAIAWQQLDSASRICIQSLLPAGTTILEASTWADEIKQHRPQTKPWHYLDLPIREDVKSDALDKFRDRHHGDILTKTEQFISELKSGKGEKARLSEDMLFVIHFIGDLSMPLHCSSDDDKGGTGKIVRFFKPGAKKNGRKINLHSLWDHVIQAKSKENPDSLATVLIKAYKNKNYGSSSPAAMLFDSYTVAKETIYPDLPKGSYKSPYSLPRNYYKMMRPIVELQLYKSGVSLLKVLQAVAKENGYKVLE